MNTKIIVALSLIASTLLGVHFNSVLLATAVYFILAVIISSISIAADRIIATLKSENDIL